MSRKATILMGMVLLLPALLPAQTGSGARLPVRPREVAVTFDDLPGIAAERCDHRGLLQLNRKLIATLAANKVPAIGLVVESRLCEQQGAMADLLELWLDAGLDLGNHTYSHFDLNNTKLDVYQADVIRGEATTQKLLRERGKKLRYFRHPLLHAGKDLNTKRSLEKFLADRGYQIAPVTIDNQEWVFAELYVRAQRRGDRALMQRLGKGYLAYMEDIFEFFENYSVAVVGYEIRQVLLLHDNLLNADYLEQLLQMMRGRGYRFVTLDRALQDPAYRLGDNYAGPRGLSWLHRWALTQGKTMKEEPREPEWVRQLLESDPGSAQ